MDLLDDMLTPLLESKVPVLVLKGNHDDNSYYRNTNPNLDLQAAKILTDKDYRKSTNARFQRSINLDQSYFYYDLEDKNTRIICLDSSDYSFEKNKDGCLKYAGMNFWGYSQEQLKWLVDVALNEPSREYIVLSHMAPEMYHVVLRDELNLILKSLTDRATYAGLGTNRDFSAYQGLQLYCFGNTHADKLTKNNEIGGTVAVSVGSAIIYNVPLDEDELENGYHRVLGRNFGSYSEGLFDVIINTPTDVFCLRYGAGQDRAINKAGLSIFDDMWKEGWRQEHDGNIAYYVARVKHTGWLRDGSTRYSLDETGNLNTGWLKDGGSWYYLSHDGSVKIGWLEYDNAHYYLDESGIMQTGWVVDGMSSYYLDKNGVMQIGWLNEGESWYFLDEDGLMKIGWIPVDNNWFFLMDNGIMATGTQYIDGRHNLFDTNGIWLGYKVTVK